MPPRKKHPRRHPAAALMQIRALHAWIGMLIAPSVLFMAATGILQIYDLHEAHAGYTPAPLIEKLGVLHKKQVFEARHRGSSRSVRRPHGVGPGPGEQAPGQAPARAKLATALLKAFFAATAAGLILSTLLGTWMTLRQAQKRLLHAILLVIGAAVPIGLLLIGG